MLLDIDVPSLTTFLPGQWVDFVVKPNDWVGGFSIASSPRDLPKLTLAVKNSDHPPATWTHDDDRSAVGVPVEIRVGGDCVLEEKLPLPPSVFCAGGIGISPILSQYREFLFLRDTIGTPPSSSSSDTDIETATTMFLYTASSAEELVFGEELAELSQQGCKKGHDRMVFALTKQITENDDITSRRHELLLFNDVQQHVERRTGRILTEFLDETPNDAIYYICGPPSMIDDAVQHLTTARERKIPLERIKYEKWW